MVSLSSKRMVAIYSVFIGLFMLGFWSMLLSTNQVPPEQKPYVILFHLAGEFLTASMLIISGIGTWFSKKWSPLLSATSLGLLLYTVIVSPGYYAQLGDTSMVLMFMTLTVLTAIAIGAQFRKHTLNPE